MLDDDHLAVTTRLPEKEITSQWTSTGDMGKLWAGGTGRGESAGAAQKEEAVREGGLHFPWWDEDTRSENTFHSYANARDRKAAAVS